MTIEGSKGVFLFFYWTFHLKCCIFRTRCCARCFNRCKHNVHL